MIPLTRQDVLAHQAVVPWPALYQIEQDLLLCRAMVAIFSDKFLKDEVAMRGGTVLHKIHLAPASRYSEDIDLVAVGERPKEHIRAALKRVLEPVLGRERSSAWDFVKLAVRNAVKPSEILRVIYEVPSVSEPGRPLRIEVEVNVSERKPFRPLQILPFSVPFRDKTLQASIASYDIHEMLGTKMRALFQRMKGRDLFDLHWALTHATPPVSPDVVIECFLHYMAEEKTTVPRQEYLDHLALCLEDAGFRNDMAPLLLTGLEYEPRLAGGTVRERLLALLPSG